MHKIVILIVVLLSGLKLNASALTSFNNPIDSLERVVASDNFKDLPALFRIAELRLLAADTEGLESTLDKISKYTKLENDSEDFMHFMHWTAKYQTKVKRYEQAIQTIKSLPDSDIDEIEMQNYLIIAKAFLLAQEMDSCLVYYKKAEDLALVSEKPKLLAKYDFEYAYYLRRIRDKKECIKKSLETLDYYESKGMASEAGQLYGHVAYCYFKASEFDSSYYYCQKAIPLLKKGLAFEALCSNYNVIGTALQNTGRLNKSITMYFKGLEIAEAFGIDYLTAAFLYNLGNCHSQINSNKRAEWFYQKCFDFAKLKADTVSYLYAANALGITLVEEGEFDKAVKYIDIAYELATTKEVPYPLSYIYIGKSDLSVAKGNVSEAQQFIDSAYVYSKKYPTARISVHIAQACIYEKQKRHKEAIDLLIASLDTCVQLNYYEVQVSILEKLGGIYKKQERFDEALTYFETAKQKNDSLNTASILEHLVNLELEYEYDKTETISRLESEKKEMAQNAKIKKSRNTAIILVFVVLMLTTLAILLIWVNRAKQRKNQLLRDKSRLITAQHDELKEIVGQLNALAEELKSSNKTKDKLFSILAHDLKSPFQAINGFSEIMQMEQLDEASRREYAQFIHEASSQLVTMVESLLLWSRSQQGKIAFSPSGIQLEQVLNKHYKLGKLIAEQKKVEMVTAYDRKAKNFVIADENMLRIVLQNLVANAIKYTPRRGEVQIGFSEEGDCLRLFVRDNGIGLRAYEIESIENDIDINSRKGTDGESGTGLGLNICKDFLEQHGSKLTVKSEPGKGAEFSFLLKRAKREGHSHEESSLELSNS